MCVAKPRTVLVTGASSGLGLATASLLASGGFVAFGTSRNRSKAGRGDFQMLRLDVDSDDSVRTCVKDVVDQAGSLDVLVNNAGYALTGAIEETSTTEAKSQFETNFFGVVRLVNRVLDRKSTRLNSSHDQISYAVFCLKKKKLTRPRSVLSRLDSD